ncbi:hypothetical protein JZ751_009396 [Albula glossodonta]|uniref:Nardilysin n=1 Tax=Albula glossodonta TaxID=121402 RepID=A0A8T2N1G3_9TELE|nr:hypothetical protein JZ751_009396 [Albula glossodonta]
MPQTNKSKSDASAMGQPPGPDRGDPQLFAGPRVGGDEDNLGDPQIVKSPSDPKQYRYIQLANGLRALLISDRSSTDGRAAGEDDEEDDSEEGEEEEEEGEEEEEEEDSGEGTEEEEEEGEEEQDSDFEELDEDNEGKKKKGKSEKQAAAALCIGVGSFSDPGDLPGLAHFLEHMVFMGSEKYPAENGFDAFLKKHGGKYQLAKPSDSHRKEMLFGSLAKPGHPMGKFCWGNAQTLKYEPREKNIDTYKRLRGFWERHYSAHYMTLAVQSRETLDTLEEWVREIFSKIPNNGQSKPDFSDQLDPFDTPAFNKLYRVVPVRKVHALTITWALPPQEKYYRVKPLHYISWLIGHEGTGSILSLLRKKCWALALFGGNSETGFDQNSTYSIFSISITLTDEGYQNFYQVADLVFQYLKMLQTLGPQQRIYEEIQKIEDNEFHYQEQTDPIEYVEDICENLQLFPKEDFLTGDQLMFEYKPEVISAALNLLTPDRANLMLLSPEQEGSCELRERWFGTQYGMHDIQQEWRDRWSGDFPLNPELHLPAENKFIATDFTLKTSDCPDTDYPVRILNTERGCLWFRKDNKFKIPKAYIRFHLISPVIQKSPENLVLFDLFLLFNLIVDYLADFSAAPDVFSMFVEQLKKTYFNILIKPEKLSKDVRLLILEQARWSVVQKYEAIMKGLSITDLMEFTRSLKSELYAEGLVQGNFTSTESMQFLQYVTEKLQFRPLSVEVPVLFRVVELPEKAHLCKVKSLNKGDANSEVTVYYQSGPKALKEHTLMELLVMHMEEPCFDFLRTKETLGYHVYPTCRNTSDEAFRTQVTALIKLKECEDTHLGEEVDRNWFEVVTQQYVFNRLNREVEALKQMTKAELLSWFQQHRGPHSRKLSVHVVGFGEQEGDPPALGGDEEGGQCSSSYGEVSKLTFLPATPRLPDATIITDIRAFTASLNLFPYHKILQ